MPKTNLVRPSRDGDQFHYLWAARRCLQLLSSQSDLVAISIEGPSPDESGTEPLTCAGEEVIDIAEYFGSEEIIDARLVRYMQLKHSTLHATDPWTASGLKKTIKGFAKRYRELLKTFSAAALASKLEFWFVTNRPISKAILETVTDVAAGISPHHPKELLKLERFAGLKADALTAFLKLLRFEDRQDSYWEQRNILFQDVRGYLPDADVDGPLKLKELVTRRALSEGGRNPIISKVDILRALGTDESSLFPAPCRITSLDKAVLRTQEPNLIRAIEEATAPVILRASAGVGKSVFSMRIAHGLPEGSTCIVYDCFGNGQYRSASGYRHRHKDALVQMANELAGKGLCHLLIPTAHADASAYVRAFVQRMRQAATLIHFANPNALLCIVVDAADNAQMAAEEIGESRAFVRDLIREKMPDNVRLVFLCRSHRQSYLDPPVDTIRLELQPFSQEETAAHLRQCFPDASEHDINEFHRLSSQNPRVQALALSKNNTLPDTLRLLGPSPTTVEDTIGSLLEDSIAKLKDSVHLIEKAQIDKICAGLAALRPLIPIPILSKISGVEEEAIKSFAIDLGRPLLVTGDTIQFFDEPAETWFREKFKPPAEAMGRFIASLMPLAATSTYVASTLPQLMLEAGKLSELVELALTSTALPEKSPLEKRDVELQRLQFALKAGLRTKRYLDATKLALKAGGETAGEDRQRKILQANTDLAAAFLETDLIQEIVSRRTFKSDWLGSHNAYEAALLSGKQELLGEARSHLRMAYAWLHNWNRLTPEARKREKITDHDIAELILAHINIQGPGEAAHNLRNWRPRDISFRVGRIVARRLIDHGRSQDAEELARAAGNNLCLVLAVGLELRKIQRPLPAEVASRAFRLTASKHIKLRDSHPFGEASVLNAVTALVEASLQHRACTPDQAAELLSRYLPSEPPRGLSSPFTKSRFPLLRAYCLRAALQGQVLELRDLAYAELKVEVDKQNQHSTSRELQEFLAVIGTLLPWHQLWAATLLGRVTKASLEDELKRTREASRRALTYYHHDNFPTSNDVARLWLDILHKLDATDATTVGNFLQWKSELKGPLFTPTLTALARLCSQKETTKTTALEFALEAFKLTKSERADAESKSEDYINAARAILTVSRQDAKEFFNEAVVVASKIGDENLSRWNAILDLADRAARADRPTSEVAYQFARCAELTYDYVYRDKHFDWQGTIEALCGLCPSSTLAILSRWRDRKFGWSERILPIAVECLIERGSLDALDAQPLIGFRAQWTYDWLLDRILGRCATHAEKAAVAAHLYRYMLFQNEGFSKLKEVASRHSVTIDGLDEVIAFKEKAPVTNRTSASQPEDVPANPARNWDDVFAGCDLADVDGLSSAYAAFRDTEPPFYIDQFFKEAIRRVSVGSEAAFIKAVGDMPVFDLYHLRDFLEQAPVAWKERPAIIRALADTLKAFCRRYCLKITKNRYYEEFPFKTACDLAGISETDLVDTALDSIGKTSDPADYNRLFSLVGLLVIQLSKDEALDALKFGLNLFTPILEDRDGDGPWSDKLMPPTDIKISLAGYIWASMAAPEGVLRWEGSHAVLGLAVLGRQDVLAHLMKLAAEQVGGPFVDAKLPFYSLHALQWFLIGIVHAAKDFPAVLAPFAGQIRDWALKDQPHVLIRQFAARATLALINTGILADQDGLKERLTSINISQLPMAESKSHKHVCSKEDDAATVSDDDRYFFNSDIGRYWYEPLGCVFALSQEEIEKEALQVIRTNFGFMAKRHWEEDERSRRKLYEERHTYHSHGSYPRANALDFYHAYHAMMIVAGKLLATISTHHDSRYGEKDPFADWLDRHDLSRTDGRWLWDRRDPTPLERPRWQDRETADDAWRFVTIVDFDEALNAGGMLNVWGSLTVADSHCEQSVHIRSALVSPDKALALIRALSTTKSVNYGIPSADGDMEIDESGFVLKGWIVAPYSDSKLDDQDRWAGGISFPPSMPAPYIKEAMKLETDRDCRFWKDEKGLVALVSQVWGHYDEAKTHESINPECGNRLQVSLSFLTSMLAKFGKDLIIQVRIDRRQRSRSFERELEDDKERIPISVRLYLLGADGRFRTR